MQRWRLRQLGRHAEKKFYRIPNIKRQKKKENYYEKKLKGGMRRTKVLNNIRIKRSINK